MYILPHRTHLLRKEINASARYGQRCRNHSQKTNRQTRLRSQDDRHRVQQEEYIKNYHGCARVRTSRVLLSDQEGFYCLYIIHCDPYCRDVAYLWTQLEVLVVEQKVN